MNTTVLVINAIAIIGILISLAKEREKTIQALKVACKSLFKMLPLVFTIVIVVGLFMGFIPPENIEVFFSQQSGISGILIITGLGAVLHIPSLIAFPLASSMLDNGASVSSVAAFITSLTMVGTILLPLEIKILGRKIAFLRNGLSFIVAILIALLMGLIL